MIAALLGAGCSDSVERGPVDAGGMDAGAITRDGGFDGGTDAGPPDGGASAPRAPRADEVIFVELMPNPSVVSDFDGEWFELLNRSDATLELADCVLVDSIRSHEVQPIGGSLQVAAGDIVLMAKKLDPRINGGIEDVDYAFGLSDEGAVSLGSMGGAMELRCDDQTVDRVDYDESWPFARGRAMQLDPLHEESGENAEAGRWCVATALYGDPENAADYGTPGLPNGPCASGG